MFFCILVIILIILIICDAKTKPKQASTVKTTTSIQEGLNIDNDFYLIRNGCLIEYRGQSDGIIVPTGVEIIGCNDTPICKKTIDHIFIPRTVHKISDFALPYVETIHYEGPQHELWYNAQYNFYTEGWIPDWAKTLPTPYRVDVHFHFNYQHHNTIAASFRKDHPEAFESKQ